MKQIVIMPGGFHPFHAGHFALYQSAKKKFPDSDVYIAATNDQSERPFPFNVKEKLATLAGVEPGHFVQVKEPFKADEITSKYDPEDTVLIYVKSTKNAKGGSDPEGPFPNEIDPVTGKLPLAKRGPNKGKPVSDRLQYYKGNEKNLQPMSRHTYLAYLPTVKFGSGMTSGSQIRKAWPTLDKQGKSELIQTLYPSASSNTKLIDTVIKMFNKIMGSSAKEKDMKQELAELYARIKPLLNEAGPEQKEKLFNILEAAKKKFEAANPAQQAAIAINMKKQGKKPKSVSESSDYLPEK